MSQSDTSLTEQGRHQHSRRRHRRFHRGNVTLGRIYLIVLLLLDRVYDVWNLSKAESYARSIALPFVVPFGFVDTALFVALLFRQPWARYGLILFHTLIVLSFIIMFPVTITRVKMDHAHVTQLIIAFVLHSTVIWALISSADIRRLTSRSHEQSM